MRTTSERERERERLLGRQGEQNGVDAQLLRKRTVACLSALAHSCSVIITRKNMTAIYFDFWAFLV
jgi:hypothetical protein